jgi:cyclomaltodextrinase / maltogenic alpha-amylase / neopullulanase
MRNSYIFVLVLPILLSISCGSKSEQATTRLVSEVVHPEWSYNTSIYEVNVRQFSPEGTFKAVQNDLPRLKELGVGILWFMPIHPIGEVNRKGTLGSYYSVKDYFDVNPEFGTKEDFRNLVNAAQEMGFYVILDWVANHTAWDNPVALSNPEFFEKDSDGNFIPPKGTDWDDVIQLDFTNKELHEYMISALEYWVREFNIDGYRCDVADMVPVEFWNEARVRLDAVKPVFMLAEAENPEHHIKAFDMSYGWEMHHTFNRVAQGEYKPSRIDSLLQVDAMKFPENAFRMQFTSNHDENSWNGTVFERMGDGAEVFAVVSATIPGMPLIYNGQEAGMDKRLEFFERDPIVWRDHSFFDVYRELNSLKSTNPALANGEKGGTYKALDTTSGSIFSFSRVAGNSTIVVIANLSNESVSGSVTTTGLSGSYSVFMSDLQAELGSTTEFDLDPWRYVVYIR